MKKKRHKWSSKVISRRIDGGTIYCLHCGCVKQYVLGVPTYFIKDSVYLKAPNCIDKTTLKQNLC